MILKYNNGAPNGIVTFTGIPNIVTLQSDSITGSKAKLTITMSNLTTIDLNKEYYISVNNQTITSGAGSNSFYITNTSSTETRRSVAYSIVQALRNSDLSNYIIYQNVEQVIVEAREVGELYNITFDSNLGSAISTNNSSGTTTDEFAGGTINIDVYAQGGYITTLTKNYYKEQIDFNVSDVLKSVSRYDFITPYNLKVYSYVNNVVRELGTIYGNSAIGYMVNQGRKYIDVLPIFAQNVSRGDQTGVLNKTVLYTYLPSIPVTIYSSDSDVEVVNISYLSSDKQVIGTGFYNMNIFNKVGYADIALDSNLFNQAYYVDLYVEGIGTMRYNIIKPVDANSRCQRVYYHNSYGGVSFFDFTGEITENHKVDNETFTKNIYDYYRDSSLEEIKIYDKETTITVTMKSHLMERSAVWQFNDFLGSYDMWTIINGVNYKIICTDVKVDETETGVWQATAVYTYSLV